MDNSILAFHFNLVRTHPVSQYEELLLNYNEELHELIKIQANLDRKRIYGNKVFIRGLIEISNVCKNNCFYCGIRGSNENCQRYSMNHDEILKCCVDGYDAGIRTFVLQSGENDCYDYDSLRFTIGEIKKYCPDCAITLSLGEKSSFVYSMLFHAGADRYLLRHEAADKELYEKLHPENMSYENRMECLKNLKKIGFQTGCGFMVGAPHQTVAHIAKDLKFIEEFMPEMCGIGPFIPHKDTIFANEKAGSVDFTCFLLSIIRHIVPNVLLPATTALSTLDEYGIEKGILSGANVIMPNLTPAYFRNKYDIYDNKYASDKKIADQIKELQERMEAIGFMVDLSRGDHIKRRYSVFDKK